MIPNTLRPLSRGSLALRFRTQRLNGEPKVNGIQCVEVLDVDGDRITWTNHERSTRTNPPGLAYVGICNRRELIALDALENP